MVHLLISLFTSALVYWVGIGRIGGEYFLAPSLSRSDLGGLYLIGECKIWAIVYRGNVKNSNELRARIVRATKYVTKVMLVYK